MEPAAAAPEVLFYHLESQTLDAVLPTLLEKTLARGWRALVRAGSEDRLEALDAHLWTYRDDSFLAHGTAKAGAASEQPIFLTTGADNPNGAAVCFLVDGAEPERFADYQRFVWLFDGHDAQAVAQARTAWRTARDAGCVVTYWQQGDGGRWEKKA